VGVPGIVPSEKSEVCVCLYQAARIIGTLYVLWCEHLIL